MHGGARPKDSRNLSPKEGHSDTLRSTATDQGEDGDEDGPAVSKQSLHSTMVLPVMLALTLSSTETAMGSLMFYYVYM